MKKNAKRFLSMLLALSMVFSLLVFPAGATEVHDHEHTEDASAVADKDYEFVVDGNITIVPLKTEGVELDKEDPVIIAVEKELKEMMVLNAEGDPVPLTQEEIQTVLYLFQQYLDQWEDNSNLLGVQVPFFLQYNDNGEDGLGILGEMLAMAGIDVATVRAGYLTMDDLVGMIYNFYYGDQLGLKYYGDAIASARNEVMDLINNSGAKTEAQKLLVLNDWLAHNVTFDMPYIMNSDKEEGEEPMVAADPQEHERYDDVYAVMFEVYKANIQQTFEDKIKDGLKSEMERQFYIEAIKQGYYDGVYEAALEMAVEEALEVITEQAWQAAYDAYIAENDDTVIAVTGIALNKNTLTLTVGDVDETLIATVAPDNATDKTVTWSSDKPEVATVDAATGKVTAVAAGTAVITAKAGDKTATCTVTVNAATVAVTGVTLDKTTATLEIGDDLTLTATVAPAEASNKAVTWSSSAATVATVDQTGKVTAVAAGTATITVTTADGSKTATCVVTVNAAQTPVDPPATDKQPELVTELVDGTYVIAVGNKALTSNVHEGYVNDQEYVYKGFQAVDVTVTDNKITGTVTESMIFEIKAEGTGYVIMQDGKYLNSTYGSNGVTSNSKTGILTLSETKEIWTLNSNNILKGGNSTKNLVFDDQANHVGSGTDTPLKDGYSADLFTVRSTGEAISFYLVEADEDEPVTPPAPSEPDPTDPPATHTHTYGDAEFVWSNDNSSATASITCAVCEVGTEGKTLTGNATVTHQTTAGTCEVAEKTVYTAKVTLNGTEYTGTKTVNGELGDHNFAEGECTVCGQTDPSYEAPVDPPVATATYKKISASEIATGKTIIIVGTDGTNYYALANDGDQKATVTVSGDTLTVEGEDTAILWMVGATSDDQKDTSNGNNLEFVFSNNGTYLGRVSNVNNVVLEKTSYNTKYFGHVDQNNTIGNFSSRSSGGNFYGLYYGANSTNNNVVEFHYRTGTSFNITFFEKVVAGQITTDTVKASPEVEAAAEAYADQWVEDNADALKEQAQQAVESDADAVAELKAAAQSETDKFYAENKDALEADPVAFAASMGEEAAAGIAQAWEATWPDWEANGIPGMVAQIKVTAYQSAIKDALMQNGYSEAQADGMLEQNAEAIAADPYAFCVQTFGQDAADQFEAGINNELKNMGLDPSTETNPEGRVSLEFIVAMQMDTAMDDLGGMTPNEAIPVYADQAAVGLTDGILDYWQGSHIGALGRGTAVCLGYTKAFTYLVQYMHPEVYGTSSNADLSKSANWKTADQLYYTNGELDITKNYIIDDVRITFDASVTMYGETEDNFNSDHFWNAVKIDGKWYYIDPCYTDVYTEVMMRDRVETDGSMNHLYFLFSHSTAAELYDGNYKEIKTLYADAATHTDYEDSWFSRIKSNTYFNGGYAYYSYDSTDLITLMQDANSENADTSELMNKEYKYKIVRHALTNSDAGTNGDTNYDTLIEFNYKANEDDEESVARVRDASGNLVENELLTELYARHEEYAEVYPSIALTSAFYNGKVYFNVANVIMSYEVSTGTLAKVKEYNVVRGVRDDTNAFGGMAFTVTTGSSYDFEVLNHPLAGLTIKDDGKLYAAVATNFAFISGKDPHNSSDQSSYGYEFEESNYNSAYNSYTTSRYGDINLEDFGYEEETNDNDEFMWTANFVETLNMSHVTGTSHRYSEVSVPAYCGQNAYTENRCTTCGVAEADSRVEVEGSAPAGHHYVKFSETYYTKDDNGNWNTGDVYVCTMCGFHIEEPTEPTKNNNVSEEDYQKQMEIYEEEKAIYDEAVATAGHQYLLTDETWADDYSAVSFSTLECSGICADRKAYLDCLLNDNTLKLTLERRHTAETTVESIEGTCPEGVTYVYAASGEVDAKTSDNKTITVPFATAKAVDVEPKDCDLTTGVCPICGTSTVRRIFGEGRVETAIATADALKEALGVETFDAIIIANGENFADALAGSYLAAVKGAPILLHTSSGAGDDLNEYYIDDNLTEGGTVYILGGEAAVPMSVEDGLKATGYKVVRLAGVDRFETGLAILNEAGVSDEDEILIATGYNFADCLSASATGKPILTVNTNANKLTDSQIEFLKAHAKNQYVIIGGTGAISQALEDAIAAIVEKDIDRVYGENREATSVKVAQRYFEEPTFALIAYSFNFPDGLCAGPLANALGAPLLLTNAGQETVTADYIANTGITNGYVMGGNAVVSDETAKLCFGITSEMEIPAK